MIIEASGEGEPGRETASPTVSVAMATYNGDRYISEQLASLAAQEMLPDELVVSDDGSTDGTIELLNQFAASAPFPVRLHRNQSRLGILKNFERALSLCTGDIVFLSDQDDVWFPGKIREVADVFGANPAALVVMNDKIITDGQLNPTEATMLQNIRGYGSPDSFFVAGCCSAHRREWLRVALPIPEETASHDGWLVGLAHDLGVVTVHERPLQYYRRHEANVSHNPYSTGLTLTLLDRIGAELRRMMRGAAKDQRDYWELELRWSVAEANRLRERMPLLRAYGVADRAEALADRLRRRNHLVEKRKRITSLSLVKRIKPLWGMWKSGEYAEFSGWKSLLKDALMH